MSRSTKFAGLAATIFAAPCFVLLSFWTSSGLRAFPGTNLTVTETGGFRKETTLSETVMFRGPASPGAPASPATPASRPPPNSGPSGFDSLPSLSSEEFVRRIKAANPVVSPAPSAAPSIAPAQQLKADEIAIYYTTNIIGEIDPCG